MLGFESALEGRDWLLNSRGRTPLGCETLIFFLSKRKSRRLPCQRESKSWASKAKAEPGAPAVIAVPLADERKSLVQDILGTDLTLPFALGVIFSGATKRQTLCDGNELAQCEPELSRISSGLT